MNGQNGNECAYPTDLIPSQARCRRHRTGFTVRRVHADVLLVTTISIFLSKPATFSRRMLWIEPLPKK